jgi:inner membrane protein
MLIAHGPAGYLLTRYLSRTVFRDIVTPERSNHFYQVLMVAGVMGGICPDFDFIYHIFIDSDRTPHHEYFTHLPLFWAALWTVSAFLGRVKFGRRFTAVASLFCASALLHLVFDTLTGTVYWLRPFYRPGLNVFEVADVHVWWVQNYINHWTFLIEIGIIITAMAVFLRIRESVALVVDLFRNHPKLRVLIVRIVICIVGLGIIGVVGSMQFNIDNTVFDKTLNLKHKVERRMPSL